MIKSAVRFLAVLSIAATVLSCEKEDDLSIPMSKVQVGIETVCGYDGTEYEVVDLGLPSKTLWATCNLGAVTPQADGDFYAWAETTPKTTFYYNNYKYCYQGDDHAFTKYIREEKMGAAGYSIDNKAVMDSIDDAAAVQRGLKWRIPSPTDFAELIYRTEHKYCKLKGVKGYLFTSKEKGYEDRSIFFPFSGKIDFETNNFRGKYGFYWSRQLKGSHTNYVEVLWLDHKDDKTNVVKNEFFGRYIGLPIRPVTKK